MFAWTAFALVAATALAPPPAPPPPAPPSPPAASAPLAPEEIMRVPPALHALVQQRIDRHSPPEQRLQQLVKLAFDVDGLDLQYDAKATNSVAGSYATRRVNCLSFTLLFVALARDVGLDAQVQEVGRVLSWYEDGNALYNAGHVNVVVRIDGSLRSVDLDRSVLMDRRGPQPISDRRALAHYYNNRGAELMADGDLATAQQHMELALRMDRDFAAAWNNLGVLALRQGDPQTAAHNYATALSIDPGHVSALSNAAILYRHLGDSRHEAAMLARLQRVQLTDPFHQYLLGNEAERRQDYVAAIGYYRHALRLYDNAHLLYFALARVYLLNGDPRRANWALQQAVAHADKTAQPRYQAKLEALRRLSHNAQVQR